MNNPLALQLENTDNMNTYSYSRGDRLEDRNRYSYTPFVGKVFLDEWQSERTSVLSQCPTHVAPPPAWHVQSFTPISGDMVKATAPLMEWVYGQLGQDAPAAETETFLWNLMDRFENVKRFHEAYNERFRAVDKTAYLNTELYVRAAEIFHLAYAKDYGLPYLNVFLKVVDTLCAMFAQLNDDQKARLAWLIETERQCIEELVANHGTCRV